VDNVFCYAKPVASPRRSVVDQTAQTIVFSEAVGNATNNLETLLTDEAAPTAELVSDADLIRALHDR
jgi:hypothetical protein